MKLPHAYTRRLAVASLSDGAFRLHLSALDFCAEQRTAGHLPVAAAALLPRLPRSWRALAIELVVAGLWAQADDGWSVLDAEQHDPELLAKRREAGRKGGLARSKLEAPLPTTELSTVPSKVLSTEASKVAEHGGDPSLSPTPPLPEITSPDQALFASSPEISPSEASGSRPESEPARGSKVRRSKPRTEAPDWIEPTPRQREIATERGIDLNVEIERCLAHHRGKGNLQASWSGTLTTWLLSPYAKAMVGGGNGKPVGQNFARLSARIARMEREEAEREAH